MRIPFLCHISIIIGMMTSCLLIMCDMRFRDHPPLTLFNYMYVHVVCVYRVAMCVCVCVCVYMHVCK